MKQICPVKSFLLNFSCPEGKIYIFKYCKHYISNKKQKLCYIIFKKTQTLLKEINFGLCSNRMNLS